MNKTEVARLFGEMVSVWKTFDPARESIKTWIEVLGDASIEDAQRALKKYASTGSQFPPNPYQILGNIPQKTAARDTYSDPKFCRLYLQKEIERGMVVCGEDHVSGGFSYRLRRHSPYFIRSEERILFGLPVQIWRD